MKTTKPKLILSAPNMAMLMDAMDKYFCKPSQLGVLESGQVFNGNGPIEGLFVEFKGGRFRLVRKGF